MKSNLTEHMTPINWNTVRKQEVDDIMDWLDEDVDSYVRFLAWRQIRDAYKAAETDWAGKQNTTVNLDGNENII
jgi:hypothetical protein